ncbi:hypothetical protein [Vibrio cholerae]|uniref:Uncharacterized protein n=2 Tax=Vibrio cholerae TaxID=666 RepID=A0A0K9UD18_VIBCL|nr:hypothetical protein [Vibrio cholerae]EAZ74664.1 hypothetical protein A5C_A0488 [Vibrio cholerae NCTC 8457]HAS2380034.1 hypothetical protein [Vibrio cholerae O1]ACP07361.1 hypothetical protein VCM66_A0391 [Vibrio cholerae M66-2]ANR89093.1 hypothetical protein BBB50_15580 [Vibrio cholerae 2740-80]ANR89116.1 hypothetical protein BBB50_15695 [Vibrio cholerae 2740-80]
MLEVITLLGKTIAVISACWAIVSGVGAWKREFIGKRRIELAEETLATFFEIKDAIAFIRSPFASVGEGESRVVGEREKPEETELLNRGHIVFERYEKKREVFIKFETLKYKFMATYGEDSEAIFKDTNKAVNSIFSSARLLATRYWQRQGRAQMSDDEFEKHLEGMQKHEDVFWDTWEDDDVIRKQLQSIQDRLDGVVASTFEEPMPTYKLLTKKLW